MADSTLIVARKLLRLDVARERAEVVDGGIGRPQVVRVAIRPEEIAIVQEDATMKDPEDNRSVTWVVIATTGGETFVVKSGFEDMLALVEGSARKNK